MSDYAYILDSINTSDVYFYFESDEVDWTLKKPVNFIIHFNNQKYIIELLDDKEIEKFAASFAFYLRKSKLLLSWNYKNIISFFK